MSRLLIVSLLCVALLIPIASQAQIAPPADGVELPQAYLDRIRTDRTAFQLQHAWLHKTKQIRENREAYISQKGFYNRELVSPELKPQLSLMGTIQVPVFMVKFSNTGADPYPTATMDTRLYTGPHAPRTLTQYYNEISYGDLNMTGAVYGWTALPNIDTFYEGPAGCNGLCGASQVQSLMNTALTANDGAVNFGVYDNDGPDGIPNSGDDDGFVDFVAFVHPEAGGECGGTNIWSHRWVYSGWGGGPYVTNDPAFGGGFIQVQDYVIQPAFNCGGVTVIDIGVFCHEFGHALGLPDLYDTNGGSQGIGHWGLMGAGNWNTPPNPAHMSTWSKSELGWATVLNVDGKKTTYSITNSEFNRTAYRLNIMEERWRRQSTCIISGGSSMRLGLTAAEGAARNWVGADGYGDGWREKISHQFSYDGTPGVSFTYDAAWASEPGYDYTYGRIDVNGTVSTFVTYNGIGSGPQAFNLDPYLLGSGASTYTISFEFESDPAWSDRDGNYNTNCGPFVFDNVSLVGGGENHATGFETREDGWCNDMTSPAEYFHVENRQPVGSDVALAGGGGLLIWHINYDLSQTGSFGNQGNGGLPRGVMPEQADGLYNLEGNLNRGDGGDPFPGSTGNVVFDNFSIPDSRSDTGLLNNVCVINIGPNPANGGNMSADMRAGWFPPFVAGFAPAMAPTNSMVTVTITGSGIACGATAELQQGGLTIVSSQNEVWSGKDLLDVDFDLTGVPAGNYDLVVFNPGNSCTVVTPSFYVDNVLPTALRAFDVHEVEDGVELTWQTGTVDSDIIGWRVYRRANGEESFSEVSEGALPAETRKFHDTNVIRGASVVYRLSWITADYEAVAAEGGVKTTALRTALLQNYPNPFNPTTTIPFVTGEAAFTTLKIYNLRGQLVRTLVSENLPAASHTVKWDGRNDAGATVTSGVYFYKLVSGTYQDVNKMLLMK